MSITFSGGRYGYGGKFGSGEWISSERLSSKVPGNHALQTIKKLISEGRRSKESIEKLIQTQWERGILSESDINDLLK